MSSLEKLKIIEAVCSRFESEGRSGPLAIAEMVDQVDSSIRSDLAKELIAVDIELKMRRGHSSMPSDYRDVLHAPHVDLSDDHLEQLFSAGPSLGTKNGTTTSVPRSQRYRFLEKIGSGAHGDVWKVEDAHSRRILAVKVLRSQGGSDPNAMERLQREAFLTGQLQHPGIPPIYDHGTLDDGTPYFLMKLVGGETFESILRNRDPQDRELPRCIATFEQLAQTVAYAHATNVIHRDLKPHNVMVGDFGEVQVMDWGMAKRLDADSPSEPALNSSSPFYDNLVHGDGNELETIDDEISHSLTTEGDILGTPSYMSPEQARGEKDSLDARSDVFALGAILFQILTHRRLHQGLPIAVAISQTASGRFDEQLQWLRECEASDELISLCDWCLRFESTDRPADARVVSQAVTAYLSNLDQRARQAEIERREAVLKQSESSKRKRLQLIMAVSVAVVSILGAGAAFWQRQHALAAQKATSDALALADKRLELAQNAVDDLLLEVSNEQGLLARAPGAQEVRKTLLEKARDYHQSFLDESADDPRLQLKVAETYLRLAQVLFLLQPGSEDPREHADKAIGISEKILKQNPEDPDALKVMASGNLQILRCHAYTRRYRDAKPHGEKAIETLRRLVEIRGTTEEQFGLAKAIQNLAMVLDSLRKTEESLALFDEAISIARPIQHASPENADYAHQLGRMHNGLAIVTGWKRKKWNECQKGFEEAIASTRTALEIQPSRPDIQVDLAMQQMNLAMSLTHTKQKEKAKRVFEECIESNRRLVLENPRVPDYLEDLVRAQSNFSTFCRLHIKRLDLAERAIGGAVRDSRKLIEIDPLVKHHTSNLINQLTLWAGMKLELALEQSEEPISPSEFAAEEIAEIVQLIRVQISDASEQNKQKRPLAYWLALDSATKASVLLELTSTIAEADPKKLKSLDEELVLGRALALIRAGRNEEAAEFLESAEPEKPSNQWQLVTCLALIPIDLAKAQMLLQDMEKKRNGRPDDSIDLKVLGERVQNRLQAASKTDHSEL